MHDISDSQPSNRVIPLFRLAFRPFFSGAALFSLAALSLWAMFWVTGLSWNPYGGWIWWHMHEMLFGFVAAIIVGFLLTAVQTWTGLPSISGWPLFTLFCLWLVPRGLLLFSIGPMFLPWLDVSFLLISAGIMAALVIRAGQKQQFVFVVLLLLLAFSNAQMHWAVLIGDGSLARSASHSGLFVIVMMMVVMGGRVIPFFTANATNRVRNAPRPWLEILALGSVGLIAFVNIGGLSQVIPGFFLGLLFLLAGISHLYRFIIWRPWTTLSIPLLWSLHLAYLIIISGFFLGALYFFSLPGSLPGSLPAGLSHSINLDYPTILHSFTIGGTGLLIIAMMARVSLGHTGRILTLSGWMSIWMSIGFVSIAGAYVCRVLLPILVPAVSHYSSYLLSIALWILGYGIFVIIYLPLLARARVDGKPG